MGDSMEEAKISCVFQIGRMKWKVSMFYGWFQNQMMNVVCWSNILTKLCVVLYQYQDQQIIFHLIRYADIKGRITSPTLHYTDVLRSFNQKYHVLVCSHAGGVESNCFKILFLPWKEKIIEYFCIEKQFSISKKKIWCGGFEQRPPEFQLIPSNSPGATEQQAPTLNVLMIQIKLLWSWLPIWQKLISFSLFVCWIFSL